MSLELLRSSGIHKLDVDVLLQQDGRLLLAHPSELIEDPNNHFQRAPCSNMDLRTFLLMLRQIFTYDDDFYLTMEPKANWPGQAVNSLLSEPKVLLEKLLTELPGAIQPAHCGIILSPDQLRVLGPNYETQIFHACRDLVYPLAIRSPFQIPPSPPYTIFMPTIEHYEALRTADFTIPTIVWVVDDKVQLTQALKLPHMKGIITNQPQKLQEMLEAICT